MQKNIRVLIIFSFLIVLFSLAQTCYALEIPTDKLPGFKGPATLPNYIIWFFKLGMTIGGVLAAVSLAMAGIQFMISAANPESKNEAKKRAIGSILGLILLLASYIMIGTINPELENIKISEDSKASGFFRFCCSQGKETSAPLAVDDLSTTRQSGYNQIKWPKTITNIGNASATNCDPDDPNAVYDVYFFKNLNQSGYLSKDQISCGNSVGLPGGAKSYTMIRRNPGVYFFTGSDCTPGPGQNFPEHHTSSIPQADKKFKSLRIINDPEKNKFFGVILFNDPDYKTNPTNPAFLHIKNQTFGCESISDDFPQGASFAIYKWVGFDKNNKILSAGPGVTLYTRPMWQGGFYEITVKNDGQKEEWEKSLSNTPAYYPPNVDIPQEERDQCKKFISPSKISGAGPYHCLQSIEIKGNYLVLVSSQKDDPYSENAIRAQAQIFPISPRINATYINRPQGFTIERGTPNLNIDYITKENANFLKIIPLADPLASQ